MHHRISSRNSLNTCLANGRFGALNLSERSVRLTKTPRIGIITKVSKEADAITPVKVTFRKNAWRAGILKVLKARRSALYTCYCQLRHGGSERILCNLFMLESIKQEKTDTGCDISLVTLEKILKLHHRM